MAAFFLIPVDGFPVLGFIVLILQFFALGTHGEPDRALALTTAFAAVTSVIGTLLGPEAPVTAIGGVLVVVAPVLAGRLVRHLRHQNAELTRLAGSSARNVSAPRRPPSEPNAPGSPRSCTTWSATR